MKVEAGRGKRGTSWTAVGIEPYTRQDGAVTMLRVWQTACKTCGKPFTIRTPQGVTEPGQSRSFTLRTCPDHRGSVRHHGWRSMRLKGRGRA